VSESHSTGGIGLPTVLGAIFITLKLTGHVAWSWWWVLSPFWICAAIWLLILGFILLIAVVSQ
jgi:hypothetical protein